MERIYNFDTFWNAFDAQGEFCRRHNACYDLWCKQSASRQRAIIDELYNHLAAGTKPKQRNPYFYLKDFHAPCTLQMSFDDYYKKYGTTADTDGWTKHFLPDEHKTIYVKTTLPSRDHLPTTKRD